MTPVDQAIELKLPYARPATSKYGGTEVLGPISWPAVHGDGCKQDPAAPRVDLPRQREVVAAFLAASQKSDFDALQALLDPDVMCRAPAAAQQMTGRARRQTWCASRGKRLRGEVPREHNSLSSTGSSG